MKSQDNFFKHLMTIIYSYLEKDNKFVENSLFHYFKVHLIICLKKKEKKKNDFFLT